MRTSSLPPVRVEPEFRSRIEGVLKEGETLSSLIVSAVRQEVTRRINVAEFHKRGFESLTHARETGAYFTAEEVLPGLEARLAAAKAQGRHWASAPHSGGEGRSGPTFQFHRRARAE